jgi:hypothetical protein
MSGIQGYGMYPECVDDALLWPDLSLVYARSCLMGPQEDRDRSDGRGTSDRRHPRLLAPQLTALGALSFGLRLSFVAPESEKTPSPWPAQQYRSPLAIRDWRSEIHRSSIDCDGFDAGCGRTIALRYPPFGLRVRSTYASRISTFRISDFAITALRSP